jgi:hypothetical protein
MGRPTDFTDALADEICKRLAEGRSLRAIGEEIDMPSAETVRRWLRDNEAFRGQYALAREEQASFYADEIIEIADTEQDPNRARVRIDARKWKASKMAPKAYGDKLDVTSGGECIDWMARAQRARVATGEAPLASDETREREKGDEINWDRRAAEVRAQGRQ